MHVGRQWTGQWGGKPQSLRLGSCRALSSMLIGGDVGLWINLFIRFEKKFQGFVVPFWNDRGALSCINQDKTKYRIGFLELVAKDHLQAVWVWKNHTVLIIMNSKDWSSGCFKPSWSLNGGICLGVGRRVSGPRWAYTSGHFQGTTPCTSKPAAALRCGLRRSC